jgi:sec-independent protein translocase protein TatB
MFDIGFSELMIIGIVALVVLGPERLPKVAKQAGEWMGKLQRYVADVKSDINRQMEVAELRKMQEEVKEAARSIETSVQSSLNDTKKELDSIQTSFLEEPPGTPAPEPSDWEKSYALRRTRDKIKERRIERAKELGLKLPKKKTW